MSAQSLPEEDRVRPGAGGRHLWFTLLGSAAAWSVHFLALYLLHEVACRSGWQNTTFVGINGIAAAVLLITLLALPVVAASALVARRVARAAAQDAAIAERNTHLGRAGMILSAIFALAIVFATIPALVLPPCGYGS